MNLVERLRLASCIKPISEADLHLVADEIERLQALDKDWQPIATAPKDGSLIMVWREHCVYPRIVKFDVAYGEFSKVEDGEYLHHPTHWMPLPDGPEGRMK